jgi:hypothetical protein
MYAFGIPIDLLFTIESPANLDPVNPYNSLEHITMFLESQALGLVCETSYDENLGDCPCHAGGDYDGRASFPMGGTPHDNETKKFNCMNLGAEFSIEFSDGSGSYTGRIVIVPADLAQVPTWNNPCGYFSNPRKCICDVASITYEEFDSCGHVTYTETVTACQEAVEFGEGATSGCLDDYPYDVTLGWNVDFKSSAIYLSIGIINNEDYPPMFLLGATAGREDKWLLPYIECGYDYQQICCPPDSTDDQVDFTNIDPCNENEACVMSASWTQWKDPGTIEVCTDVESGCCDPADVSDPYNCPYGLDELDNLYTDGDKLWTKDYDYEEYRVVWYRDAGGSGCGLRAIDNKLREWIRATANVECRVSYYLYTDCPHEECNDPWTIKWCPQHSIWRLYQGDAHLAEGPFDETCPFGKYRFQNSDNDFTLYASDDIYIYWLDSQSVWAIGLKNSECPFATGSVDTDCPLGQYTLYGEEEASITVRDCITQVRTVRVSITGNVTSGCGDCKCLTRFLCVRVAGAMDEVWQGVIEWDDELQAWDGNIGVYSFDWEKESWIDSGYPIPIRISPVCDNCESVTRLRLHYFTSNGQSPALKDITCPDVAAEWTVDSDYPDSVEDRQVIAYYTMCPATCPPLEPFNVCCPGVRFPPVVYARFQFYNSAGSDNPWCDDCIQESFELRMMWTNVYGMTFNYTVPQNGENAYRWIVQWYVPPSGGAVAYGYVSEDIPILCEPGEVNYNPDGSPMLGKVFLAPCGPGPDWPDPETQGGMTQWTMAIVPYGASEVWHGKCTPVGDGISYSFEAPSRIDCGYIVTISETPYES